MLAEQDAVELRILGTIPPYVAGTLYRTGPYGFQVEDTPKGIYYRSHWFDAFSQTHRFEIIPVSNNGMKIIYSSRSQVDGLVEKIRKTGDFHTFTFAQKRDPCIGLFGKVMSTFTPVEVLGMDTASVPVTIFTNLPGIASDKASERNAKNPGKGHMTLHLASDFSFLKELDAESLKPMGLTHQKSLHPSLKGPLSCAHTMLDPETGDVFNYNLDLGRYATYRVFRVNATSGTTDILATITGPGISPAYLHSFFLTQDFVILCIWNSHLAMGGLKVLWEKNILDAISPFDPTQKARWFVVDRRHGCGVVAEFESPAAFSFHTVNAWQETNLSGAEDIYCDVIEYPNLDILHRFYYSNLMSSGENAVNFLREKGKTSRPRLSRYILRNVRHSTVNENTPPPAQAELVFTIPNPSVGDIPTINPAYAAKANRYIYSLVDRGLSTIFDGLSKVDTVSKRVIYWDNPKGHTPGEAIFVADPDGKAEDDGILLSVVLDGFKGTSYLVCLDARTMIELGRAECECAIGLGFHGTHISSNGTALCGEQ